MHDAGDPTTSLDTMGASEYTSTPAKGPSVAAARNTSFTSSTVTSRQGRDEVGDRPVRHGGTASNRERRTMGWLEEGIEPGWVRAAASVAGVLAREPVDGLVSSPLTRALQTAAPLAARLSRQPIVDDGFGELRVGDWEGYAEDEIAERWPEQWQPWRSEPTPWRWKGERPWPT